MESTNVNTPSADTNIAEPRKPIDNTSYLCKIECSIRRKPSTVGLPGQDQAERIYRIGASLSTTTRTTLKGIAGELENKFMPEIIGYGIHDPLFRKGVEDYWSSISRVVPHDETYQKEHEKGLILKIHFHIKGKARKEAFDTLVSISEKIEFLNKFLVLPIKDASGNDTNEMRAIISYDFIPDYLLLNYSLKYSKVANTFADVDKSPKIDFYIFEKSVATKNQVNAIDLREKAMSLYREISDNSRKIDAVILHFNEDPNKYDTDLDKLLRIDELYNSKPIDNMVKFIAIASDTNWETKYLINLAIKRDKVRSPANSSAIYYSDTLLGMNIEEAANMLNNEEAGKLIKENLLRELNK